MRRDKLDKLLKEQPEEVRRLRVEYDTLNDRVKDLNSQLYSFKQNCAHVIAKSYDSAICLVCDSHMGWFCEESPNKYCEYDADDTWNDFCIYCQGPEERK